LDKFSSFGFHFGVRQVVRVHIVSASHLKENIMSSPASDPPRPSLRNHLAPFTDGPRPWLVLARNAIPVIGVYGLGWSADLVIFQIWFDSVTALGAMLAFQIRGFARNDPTIMQPPAGVPPNLAPRLLALVWLLIWLLLSIPYWFVLLFFGLAVFDDNFWSGLPGNISVMVALILALVSNLLEYSQRGYEKMNDVDIRLEFDWEFNLHMARAAAILLITFILRLGFIIGLALALSYIEIYPMRALRFFGGDRTLDADNKQRSQD
jgi:hypothetical protein